jgi:hypothetical protein
VGGNSNLSCGTLPLQDEAKKLPGREVYLSGEEGGYLRLSSLVGLTIASGFSRTISFSTFFHRLSLNSHNWRSAGLAQEGMTIEAFDRAGPICRVRLELLFC